MLTQTNIFYISSIFTLSNYDMKPYPKHRNISPPLRGVFEEKPQPRGLASRFQHGVTKILISTQNGFSHLGKREQSTWNHKYARSGINGLRAREVEEQILRVGTHVVGVTSGEDHPVKIAKSIDDITHAIATRASYSVV